MSHHKSPSSPPRPPPSSLSSASRKRNRWVAPSRTAVVNQEQRQPSAGYPQVSESDALRALLSSAEAQQQQKEQHRERELHRRPPHDRVDNAKKRPRRQDGPAYDADSKDNYYGPAGSNSPDALKAKEKPEHNHGNITDRDKEESIEKMKPDFGLSGALAKDSKGGNMYKGVVLKFREPPEARAPNTLWRFYVFKGEEQLETLHVSRQSAYLFGRNDEIADICLQHPSCSSQHAVLQYRALPNKETGKLNCLPYLMDLESTNGSFINGVRIDAARYYQLKKGDVLKFGASSREYVLLTANTTSVSK